MTDTAAAAPGKRLSTIEAAVLPLGVTKFFMYFEVFIALLLTIFLVLSIYVDTFLFVPVILLFSLNMILCIVSMIYLWCRGPGKSPLRPLFNVSFSDPGSYALLAHLHRHLRVYLRYPHPVEDIRKLLSQVSRLPERERRWLYYYSERTVFRCGSEDESQLQRFIITWIFFLAATYHLFIALLILAGNEHTKLDDMYCSQEVQPTQSSSVTEVTGQVVRNPPTFYRAPPIRVPNEVSESNLPVESTAISPDPGQETK
uniref:Transmembrane protein n=1 Tax=Steinernema glaseri TaxID=37863 RepID=A0A1I7ZBX8_9BILA